MFEGEKKRNHLNIEVYSNIENYLGYAKILLPLSFLFKTGKNLTIWLVWKSLCNRKSTLDVEGCSRQNSHKTGIVIRIFLIF